MLLFCFFQISLLPGMVENTGFVSICFKKRMVWYIVLFLNLSFFKRRLNSNLICPFVTGIFTLILGGFNFLLSKEKPFFAPSLYISYK